MHSTQFKITCWNPCFEKIKIVYFITSSSSYHWRNINKLCVYFGLWIQPLKSMNDMTIKWWPVHFSFPFPHHYSNKCLITFISYFKESLSVRKLFDRNIQFDLFRENAIRFWILWTDHGPNTFRSSSFDEWIFHSHGTHKI